MKPCPLCGSLNHAFCGFCARCKEHTVFTAPEAGETPLSECCGASGEAYDRNR